MKRNKLTTHLLGALLSASVLVSAPTLAKLSVAVEPITQAPLTSILTVNGTLYGKQDVVLTSGVSGRLMFVAEPGQNVDEGTVLARIDTLPLELNRARQQEMLNRAKINLRFHKQELSRLEKLAKTSAAAASQVDQVQTQHDLALSDIALAEVELKVIDDQLSRATISAPFSGIVSERYKRAGRDVGRAEELLSFIDIHNLEVRLYVPVKHLAYLNKGTTLNIKTGNLNAPLESTAVISAVIPATDPRSQTVEVRATLNRKAGQSWAVGQLVDVSVPLTSQSASMLINRDALILRKEGVHIVKIGADNKAVQIPVTVGKGQGQLVAIQARDKAQLNIGDRIAVRGAERLSDGQEVDVKE